ncbi:MAG: putative addiction module antidote protein [Trichodesmium sp. MAG_R04]|jgi:probable addiction module antidote protein|nr:putative addiction module antidote protein [Trichodesmium sp. MAG_R04]
MMTKPGKPFKITSDEMLRNPEYASMYLAECMADDDTDLFKLALKNVADAQGGVAEIAQKSSLGRQNLYKILSAKTDPKMGTLKKILEAMGLELSISPRKTEVYG